MFGKRLMKTATTFLLIGCAQTAFAQDIIPASFELKTVQTLQLAEEVFGNRPADVALATVGQATVVMEQQSGSGISVGATGALTYRLSDGAGFGVRDLTAADMSFVVPENAGATPRAIVPVFTGPTEGGARGGASATFMVGTAEDIETSFPVVIGLRDSLRLTIPGLQNLVGLRDGDRITVEVAVAQLDMSNVDPMFNAFVWPDVDPLIHDPPRNWITNDVLLEVLNQFTLRVTGDGGTTRIVPASPAGLGEGGVNIRCAAPSCASSTGADELHGIELGGVRMEQSEMTYKGPDGETDFALVEADRVRISVQASGAASGVFDQALVFIDLDDDLLIDQGEILADVQQDAQMDGVSITFSATSAAVADTLLTEPSLVYLVPGGALVREASYTLSLELDFADATFLDDRVTGPTTTFIGGNVRFRLDTDTRQLAAELLGEQATGLTLSGAQTVSLTVVDDTSVSQGAAANFEYRLLGGAQFDIRPLNASHLQFMRAAGNVNSALRTSLLSGGGLGDSRVVFRATTEQLGPGDEAALAQGDRLLLTIPGLLLPEPGDEETEIRVEAAITRITTTVGNNFNPLNPLTHGERGNIIANDILVRLGRQFTLAAEGPNSLPTVDISNRNRFADNFVSITLPDAAGDTRVQGARLGSLGMRRAAIRYKGADGLTDFTLSTADKLRIDLLGDGLHEASLVFIDLDGDLDLDRGEAISPVSGLVFSSTGSGGAALRSAHRTVYLVADGATSLASGSYQVRMTLDFANAAYRDTSVTTPQLALMPGGLQAQGFAYAVPNCTQVEQGHIHLVNETQQPLSLFVQGVDQAGTEFGLRQLDASILRGSGTARLQPREALDLLTAHLEELFDLNDGACTAEDTWQGRAQLNFFSDGDLTLVPQLRGSLGELRDLGGFSGLELGGETID